MFPLYVVCAWFGNSKAVAKKHYLRVTDEPFEAAAGCSALQNAPHFGEEWEVMETNQEIRG